MTNYNTQTPYLASFLLITNNTGKIALVLRTNTGWMDGKYGVPSGKVEKDESFTAAAVREAQEEAGVTISRKDLEYVHTMHRREPEDDHNWVDVYFRVTKWEGEAYNAEPHVHGELKWFDIYKLPENMVPAVRAAIEAVIAGKTFSEFQWNE